MFWPDWRFQGVLKHITVCYSVDSGSSGNAMFHDLAFMILEEWKWPTELHRILWFLWRRMSALFADSLYHWLEVMYQTFFFSDCTLLKAIICRLKISWKNFRNILKFLTFNTQKTINSMLFFSHTCFQGSGYFCFGLLMYISKMANMSLDIFLDKDSISDYTYMLVNLYVLEKN